MGTQRKWLHDSFICGIRKLSLHISNYPWTKSAPLKSLSTMPHHTSSISSLQLYKILRKWHGREKDWICKCQWKYQKEIEEFLDLKSFNIHILTSAYDVTGVNIINLPLHFVYSTRKSKSIQYNLLQFMNREMSLNEEKWCLRAISSAYLAQFVRILWGYLFHAKFIKFIMYPYQISMLRARGKLYVWAGMWHTLYA